MEINIFVRAGFADFLFLIQASHRHFLQFASVPAMLKYVQLSKCDKLFFSFLDC